MQLGTLILVIFPVIVAILALLVGYYVQQVKNQINEIKLTTESTSNNERARIFTLSNNNTLFDPYGTADQLLHDANTLVDSNDSDWHVEQNGTDWAIRSIYLEGGPPLHRIRLRLESKKNTSTVFKTLIDETFLGGLYPALFASSQVTVNNPKVFPLLSFDWIHGSLGLRYVTSRTMWPFHDRSFAVFNIIHPAKHTFVSKTVPLSSLDEHMLLPPKTLFKATTKAMLSMALRVSDAPEGPANDYKGPTSDYKRRGVYPIYVDLLYHVSDFLGSPHVDYALTKTYFISHVVSKILAAL